MGLGRPQCLNCSRVLSPDEQRGCKIVCNVCEDRTASDLRALAGRTGLYAQLVAAGSDALTPRPRQANSGGGGPVKRVNAGMPLRMDTLSLTSSAGGVVSVMQRWVVTWYQQLEFTPPKWRTNPVWLVSVNADGARTSQPGRIDQATDCLLNNLPWATEKFEPFRVFSLSVHRLVSDCKNALNPGESTKIQIFIGRCPIEFEDGSRCGVKLYADPYKQFIRCYGCRVQWAKDDWIQLSRYINGQ